MGYDFTAIEAKSQSAARAAQSPAFWSEQLARFDLAHIGTLHSFCLKLVREYFYELGLDPRPTLLDEGEARQLANETLDELFHSHYAGENEFSLAVQHLIQVHGGGRDEKIRALTLRLHYYSQTRPDAEGWLERQRAQFSAEEPADWRRWLGEAITDWRAEWLTALETLKSGNEKTAELAAIFSRWKNPGGQDYEFLGQIISADENWPPRQKTTLREPLKELFAGAKFLRSLAGSENGGDPLAEDWSWIRGHMETLLKLAQEFAQALGDRKRADAMLDFHDLEQFTLKLLWDFSTGHPTAIAAACRRKLKFVFVDEYQDINAAQDKIITALSRDHAEANRFLVGDVKQSIYGFRLADPKIFREYAQNWRGENGETIPLSENFRSHETLLDFVNSLFRLLMRGEAGGVNYDDSAELKPGRGRGETGSAGQEPRAELLVRFKATHEEENDNPAGVGSDDLRREARLVAWRLKQLVEDGHKVLDAASGELRPVAWRDMAILLRSPRGRSEMFAREFELAGVPLAVARGSFYESAEILDLLNLLRLLDNPLQDVPCIAVLRSPLAGLSLEELAEIRLAAREKKHFWTALARSQKTEPGGPQSPRPADAKIRLFLERFYRWRKLARQISLSQCLEEILAETFYLEWLRAQPRGTQCAANIAAFLHLAQEFDQFQRQGLFRFLKFIEARQEAEVEPEIPAVAVENAVRLMSIHQSKGLEFPVVVLAGLTRRFNEQDLHAEIILDETFGLCPKVKPPDTGRRYPSLPHWLAQRRQRRELRGEELRLLYVALTRARDHLILTAAVSEKNWAETWRQPQPVMTQTIVRARSFADWMSLWFATQSQSPDLSNVPGLAGYAGGHLRWQVVTDEALAGDSSGISNETGPAGSGFARQENSQPGKLDAATAQILRRRLEWSYPFQAATERKAKSSVTALRREAMEGDDEAETLFSGSQHLRKTYRQASSARHSKTGSRRTELSAAEIGAAHHKFLQHVFLEKTGDLAAEAERLMRGNYLSPPEREALDFEALAAFWASPLGKKIIAQAPAVRRELPFTARFSSAELETITRREAGAALENEFVVVQGVADLVVLLSDEIWVVDFKTDTMTQKELPEKITAYRPQLQLYAAALEKIFNRPVTLRALHFLAVRHSEHI